MKCKNCGYEISIQDYNEKIMIYHTGEEENFAENVYCMMVHKDTHLLDREGGTEDQVKAELFDMDKLRVTKALFKESEKK